MIKMYLYLQHFNNEQEFNEEINGLARKLVDDDINSMCYCFYRGNGYFYNKKQYFDFKEFMNENKDKNNIILTDDETMLGYVDLFNGRNYGVDLYVQDTEITDHIEFKYLLETYPNVRLSNNVRKMLLAGVFGCIPLLDEEVILNEK